MDWLTPLVQKWKLQKGIANAFGVVIYTDKHPHIKKVLADNDYWVALNEISGPRWAVFSVRVQAGHYTLPKLPPGCMGFMIPVWEEPRENEILVKKFEIESTENLPQLFIFAEGEGGEILRQSIRLDDSSTETAYDSLKTAIKVIAEAIQNVSSDNLKSAEGVHAAIDLAVSNYHQWERIKKGLLFWRWIKEQLPL